MKDMIKLLQKQNGAVFYASQCIEVKFIRSRENNVQSSDGVVVGSDDY